MKNNNGWGDVYPVLEVTSKILHYCGYAIIGISIIIIFYDVTTIDKSPFANNRPLYFSMALQLLSGFFGALFSFGSAEGIHLTINIEKNTRK